MPDYLVLFQFTFLLPKRLSDQAASKPDSTRPIIAREPMSGLL
jgi:hypothetical protein